MSSSWRELDIQGWKSLCPKHKQTMRGLCLMSNDKVEEDRVILNQTQCLLSPLISPTCPTQSVGCKSWTLRAVLHVWGPSICDPKPMFWQNVIQGENCVWNTSSTGLEGFLSGKPRLQRFWPLQSQPLKNKDKLMLWSWAQGFIVEINEVLRAQIFRANYIRDNSKSPIACEYCP